MRHGKKVNHLGRTAPHRKAMLANMASSLILHKRINTTLAKAKALRTYVEPLLTKSKNDTTHSRRTVFAYLKDKNAVTELFRDVSTKIADRPGGYTRIIKLGNRTGDNAELALIELVDYNENLLQETKTKKGAKRTRRSGAKKAAGTVAAPAAETAVEETASIPAAEAPEAVAAETAAPEPTAVEAVAEDAATIPVADTPEAPAETAVEEAATIPVAEDTPEAPAAETTAEAAVPESSAGEPETPAAEGDTEEAPKAE